jgi:DNA invertase Pin-like site-specific DNA recombinase
MIVGYGRLSRHGVSKQEQIEALRRARAKHVYFDNKTDRGASSTALATCLAGLTDKDTLVVYRLDCLAVSIRDCIELLSRILNSGARFRSILDSIDTHTCDLQTIVSALIELERNIISERTKIGLGAARARGRLGGRKQILNSSQQAEIIHLWRDEHKSRPELSALFGVSVSTIERIIRPPQKRLTK